jgi:group I intron endonuclease
MAIVGKIYIIRNLVNGKGYVGQTITTLFKRLSEHKYLASKGGSSALCRAIRKWGENRFEISLLVTCETSQLDELEKNYIQTMNTHAVRGHGYNLTYGGQSADHDEHGRVISEQGRKRLSEVHRGNSYARGHKVSPEARLEMSRAQKSRKFSSPSVEVRAKISATLMGHPVSNESREKMSLALRGKKRERSSNVRRPVSEETKAKIANFHRGKPKSPEAIRKTVETKRANGVYVVTEEMKKKISAKLSGRKLSESHRAAMSAAQKRRAERIKAEKPEKPKKTPKTLKGRKYSPEHCENISKALTGRKVVWTQERREEYHNNRAGKKWNEESRKRLSEAQQKRFQSPEQRESNRRASIIGYANRKLRTLRVIYPDGRVMFFRGSKEFDFPVHKSAIYRHATQHSGNPVMTGPLTGYVFSWVDSAESAGVTRGN